jgi:X-Pro dipeptidyl-peptidase
MPILAAATVALALLAGAPPATAAAQDPVPPGAITAEGTQPVYDYASAIREEVSVESSVDSDSDGSPDRVAVRVIRPRETEQGVKVPVIFEPSPYFAGYRAVPTHNDVDRDLQGGAMLRRAVAPPQVNRAQETIFFQGYLDNYFVPRGYAVVYADSLGTGGSDGCPTAGGENETQGMKAVVDWINGRAEATGPTGEAAPAAWSTGKVGMIGVSYDGTLANAVAATGVPGLETIVPIAAISSWYDYYRANGGVVAPDGFQGEDVDVLARSVLTRDEGEDCAGELDELAVDQDRKTGDYSDFWHERNYLRQVDRVRASVFAVHGLNDWNVRTVQTGQWWSALTRQNVPRKLWLHQGDHSDPFNVRRAEWMDTLHRWFDRWLYGIDNGIMEEPMASVETAPGQWRDSRNWPVEGTRATSLSMGGEATDGRPGTVATPTERGGARGAAGRQSFADDPSRTAEELATDPLAVDPSRLTFLTKPLNHAVRLSGTATVSVQASVAGSSPYLTALLVDYGAEDRFSGFIGLPTEDCVGPGIPGDPGCFRRLAYAVDETPFKIVSRGWLDLNNRRSSRVTEPVRQDQLHRFTWDLQPQDYVFAEGHRIGVVLISTDRDYTLRYPAGTEVSVDPRASRVILPLVNGGRELG